MRGTAVALFFALLVPGAQAATGWVELASAEPVAVAGLLAARLEGAEGQADLASWTGTVDLAGATGTLTIWTWNATRATVPAPAPVGGVGLSHRLGPASAERHALASADVRLDVADEPLSWRLVARGPVVVEGAVEEAGRFVRVDRPEERAVARGPAPPGEPDDVRWRWERGWILVGDRADVAPSGFPAFGDGTARLAGAVRLLLDAGTLSFATEDGPRSVRLGRAADGPAAGAVPVEVVREAIFEGTLASGSLPAAGVWALAAPVATFDLDGTVRWDAADGEAERAGARRAFQDARVDASGAIRLQAATTKLGLGAEAARHSARGDLSTLAIDGVALGPEGRPPAPAARVAVAASLAGLAAWAALALYTRIEAGRVLENPRRRAILEALAVTPGSTMRALHRAVGGGWGSFLVHLRTLSRAGLVRTERHGRYVVVFAAARDPALPVIPHPLARAVWQRLPEDGSVVTLRALATEFSVSQQRLKHHVRALEARALVERAWERGLPAVRRSRATAAGAG